jgi:hypothetical protein
MIRRHLSWERLFYEYLSSPEFSCITRRRMKCVFLIPLVVVLVSTSLFAKASSSKDSKANHQASEKLTNHYINVVLSDFNPDTRHITATVTIRSGSMTFYCGFFGKLKESLLKAMGAKNHDQGSTCYFSKTEIYDGTSYGKNAEISHDLRCGFRPGAYAIRHANSAVCISCQRQTWG